jgi:hypothetical protein
MTTIDIMDFELTLKNFITKSELPWRVKQLALNEICREVDALTTAEALEQAKERDSKRQTIGGESNAEST